MAINVTTGRNMPQTVIFDTLRYAKKLQEAGFTSEQAEIQAEALHDTMDNNLATKENIKELKRDIKEIEQDIKAVEGRMVTKLQELEYKVVIRLGSVIAIAVGVLAAIIKF